MRPFVLHAHFYQPERLNPWTGALDPEPSATPDRDWNERILRECYRPNAQARIFGGQRQVERIVNNYELLSFNFGPTLLSWMEQAHPDTYAQILAGDGRSAAASGHGNALAQAYNHMILPLAADRDRRTQVAWGLADFAHRFGRVADGLWLPETAADPATIDVLIDAGVRFTVLAPHQAARVRPLGADEDGWRDAGDALDIGRVYEHKHSDGSGRRLAVFFYDGVLAQSLAFDPATADAGILLERLQEAASARDGLVHAALDGETFGHHHQFGELGLAYALFEAAAQRGLVPTSYAAYLDEHPPADEVEVVGGEGTAWSCAHGVGRWYRDCGCATNSMPGWNQEWRGPLREALDVVRDAAAAVFAERGDKVLKDPWAARDDYVWVRLGDWSRNEFLERHGQGDLDEGAQADVWTLLESQRHAMVMYTSCGWFFADISGIETTYVLRSAARVLDLLEDLGEHEIAARTRTTVLDVITGAHSNKEGVGTGADVWRDQVEPAIVTPRRVAANISMLGLVRPLAQHEPIPVAGHVVSLHNHRREARGRLVLATAHMTVRSIATTRERSFAVAALHLGGTDFHGVVCPYSDGEDGVLDRLWEQVSTLPIARLIRTVSETLDAKGGGHEFDLDYALPDSRQEIVGAVFSDLTERFRREYAQLYHDHRRVLEMLSEGGYELPAELRVPAELTLSAELEQQLAAVQNPGSATANGYDTVRETLALARRHGYHLDVRPLEQALTDAVTTAAEAAARALDTTTVSEVEGWVRLCQELEIRIDLSPAQNVVWEMMERARSGRLDEAAGPLAARLGATLGFAPPAYTP